MRATQKDPVSKENKENEVMISKISNTQQIKQYVLESWGTRLYIYVLGHAKTISRSFQMSASDENSPLTAL